MNWKKASFYKELPNCAIQDLALGVRRGDLALAVGAGVSKEFELPLWDELVVACIVSAKEKIPKLSVSGDDLASASGSLLLLRMARLRKEMNDDDTYFKLIASTLYENWPEPTLEKVPQIMRALGVLMMGSVRGGIKDVINYNFDSLLEWYLVQHGFVVSVYEKMPKQIVNSDVRVYHPHGYLPFSPDLGTRGGAILFDEQSASDFLDDPANPWKPFFNYIYTSKITLGVGLSMKDPLIQKSFSEAAFARNSSRDDLCGFILALRGEHTDDEKHSLLLKGIVVLDLFDDWKEVPPWLFKLGQMAAGSLVI